MWAMLRTNREIRTLFLAQVVSFAGDWFAYVAFVGLVQDLTDAPVLVPLVYVAQALPAFLMSPIAGPAADHFDRRRLIRNASLGQAVAAAGLLLVSTRAELAVGFALLCAISALGSFVAPAAQAGLPNLARDPEELRLASMLFGSLWGAMVAVGAALGGLVAATFGRDTSFVVNTLSFVVAAALISAIRRPMQRPADDGSTRPRIRPIADMVEAFQYSREDHAVLAFLASKATFGIGSGIVGLLAVMATEELGGGDGATGLLVGARGVGVAAGPLIAARLVGPSLARVLLLCGAAGMAFGVCYLGLSVAPTLAIAACLSMLAHIGGGAQWTLSTYGLQRRAPDHLRGRILAGDLGLVTLMMALSNLAAGALADVVGPRPTVAAFAGLTLVASAVYVMTTRRLRTTLAAEEAAAAR